MPKEDNNVSDIEKEAISIVKEEVAAWEHGTSFVTEKIAFQMRDVIRTNRKNYYGIFDNPFDPITKRRKIWIPLTESIVESVVKNIDLDTKDVNLRAKPGGSIGMAEIARPLVTNALDIMKFGEDLDDGLRDLAIDGTFVWKTLDGDNQYAVKRSTVDLLNCFIDPTARSIQDAYRFTERSFMTEQEVKQMKGWVNTEGVVGTVNLNVNDASYNVSSNNVGRTTKQVDVWEMWGKIPKWLITDNKEDVEEIDGRIVVSGLSSDKNNLVHLIQENKTKDASGKVIKPYEEAWYTRVPGRWHGRGIEKK